MKSNSTKTEVIMTGRRLHGRRGLKSRRPAAHDFRGWSPPSRAAWIEIRAAEDAVIKEDVAAFTGGVD